MTLKIVGHKLDRFGSHAGLIIDFDNKLQVHMKYMEMHGGSFSCDFTVFRGPFGLYTFALSWKSDQPAKGFKSGPFMDFTESEASEYREATLAYLRSHSKGLLKSFLEILENMEF